MARRRSGPGDVLAGAGVDLDAVAGVHEQRHLDDQAGLERGRLAGARHAVALHAGLGLGDVRARPRRAGRCRRSRRRTSAARPSSRRRCSWPRRPATSGGTCELVVGLVVHEDEVVAVAVEELHLPLVDDGLLELLAGPERAVDHGAGAHVLQRGAHERAALAGLHVLEVDDLEQALGQVEGHAVLQVVGGDGGHGWRSSVLRTWGHGSGCGARRR